MTAMVQSILACLSAGRPAGDSFRRVGGSVPPAGDGKIGNGAPRFPSCRNPRYAPAPLADGFRAVCSRMTCTNFLAALGTCFSCLTRIDFAEVSFP